MRLTTDTETRETPFLERRKTETEPAASREQTQSVDSARPVVETAIEYTLADFSRYYALLRGGQRVRSAIAGCGIGTAMVLYGVVDALLRHNYGDAAAFSAFVLIAWVCLGYLFLLPRRSLKRWKRSVQTGTYHVTIGENGIRTLGAHTEGTYNWSYFNLAWEDTELFGVMNCDQAAVLVPRRYLTAEQTDALRALLQRQVPWWADRNATRRGKLRNIIRQIRKQAKSAAKAAKNSA